MQNRHSRRLALVSSVAALTLLIAACSGTSPGTEATPSVATPSVDAATPTPTASVAPVVPSKDLSGVTVTGDATPAIKVTAPWGIEKTTVKVLKEGTSSQVVGSGFALVHYLGVNGRTGEVFDGNFDKAATSMQMPDGVVKGFSAAVVGQKVGSRVLVAMTSADGYPEGRPPAILAGDTLIFVIDILAAQFAEPSGAAGTLPTNAPQVTVAASGPSVTVPSGLAAPTALGAYELIKGTGAPITEKDAVMVRYRSYTWDGKLFEDAWAKPQVGQLANVIQGWHDGLIGKSSGSRIVLAIPPALAYPNGRTTPPTLPAGQSLIYVIDVLYAAAG